jgi:hypothetical protein
MPACPEEQSAMINPRFVRRPRDPRSQPARRSLRWHGAIECLESRIALSFSASYSLVGSAVSAISTNAAQTAHAAPYSFGDLAPTGRLPVIGTTVAQPGHAAPEGFGDL